MITWGPLKAKMVKEGLLEEVAFNCKSQEKKKKCGYKEVFQEKGKQE